jgi:hypothetical protein
LDAYHAQVRYDHDLVGNRTVRRFWHQADLASAPVLAAEVWAHDDDRRVTNHWAAGVWAPDPADPWGSQPVGLDPAASVRTTYEVLGGRVDAVIDPTGRVAEHAWNRRGTGR